MSVLSDRWIKKMALEKEMIKPFIAEQKSKNVISYGLSSIFYGSGSIGGSIVINTLNPKKMNPSSFTQQYESSSSREDKLFGGSGGSN